MKNLNKMIAVLLAVVMFCLMPVADITAMAEEISDTAITENDSYQTEKSEIEENVEADSGQDESEIEEVESQETVTDGLLNYVGIDKPYLTSPDTQKIVVSYGDGTEAISEARIVYQRADGTIFEDAMSSRQEELFLFEHSFSSESKGTYTLLQFVYVENGVEQTIELQDIGIGAMFGVDEEYPGYNSDSSDMISQEEIDASVVSMASDEIDTAQEDITDAIDNTEENDGIATYSLDEQTKSGNVVVVLDPGHGGTDSGALGNGLQEKDLTLKIAKYCKEELEKYSGVTVYMTREDDRYLGNRVGDAASDLANRVNKAKEWGADLLVSIHINSGGGQGVEVYYPNSNYNATIGKEGEDSAQKILDELLKLGLKNRGIKIRSTEYDTYPDGSLRDWYGIIRRSKLAGFPGIIVEHAFIDNESDAAKLKEESFLKQCGVADATGIANYFGLSKGQWELDGSQWKYSNGDGTYKTSQWLLLNGVWYYFDAKGIMQTGWTKVGDATYYMDASGAMQAGWLYLDDTWYYLGSSGARVADCWQWINNKCYYFDNDGCMAANTWIGDSYVDTSGAWVPGKQKVVSGWKVVSGRWKYMESNGEYVKSRWLLVGSTWYHFDANGWMQTGWLLTGNTWYYLESSGAMIAGRWQWINGKCYYFDNNGCMASDTWIGNWYVDANGAWIPDKQKLTNIMGTSSVTALQLSNFYKAMNKKYPSYYSQNDKEAKTIEDFCKIYVEECKNEGVRVEVAFAQAMVETGYLSFGGDVDISQYNFAGMGATGNGVKGNSFSTVRLGIRAQVQHLKCYASTDKLNGDRVDPRWGEWLRGKAPYVEWLSIPNNPYGTGWAGSATYAEVIKGIMENINKYN
ncbi:N-acetylmuramoyl-L-alanine amidase [Dorea sp. AM58-8]|uniref:N-acetylmuramoyl-L-alanine amidase n=1 Tax=Dorea sp. AM58-8 TaxID=2292346 RepID=UPI000E478798|nr:N-acetylmuramoyl-L-alanine amidase [Dorea sp. AM58-8]RGY78944.1 N-acetylmuramoyl-L-alanine amidase [Dorea sp. AM58-8]